ncbi:hypothetical protein [Methanosarcina sp.]|uniref:hypothetical protein n=1 Tax=Methanosarcina sp. TaxID=2213 RepID=UPI002988D9AB|nr:hypothetical protein [Methanosarcina sp.]MDW5548865.1 hypothetical protein [Methanosarcina sp.]MDW5553778.1 hypothetical protein [Methanosarcina sp.]MDW5559003.1 hypothetical protein [Methanosarcina sp.]
MILLLAGVAKRKGKKGKKRKRKEEKKGRKERKGKERKGKERKGKEIKTGNKNNMTYIRISNQNIGMSN